MSAFTPGPYTAVHCSSDPIDIWSVTAGEHTTIAKCVIPGKLGRMRNRENAILLAAAPDLAAATSNLLKAFRECIGGAAFWEFEQSNPAVRAAQTALAKAGL